MKKERKKELSVISICGLGGLHSVVISILLAMLIPILILNGHIQVNAESVIVPAVQFISVFVGGLVAGKIAKYRRIQVIGGVAGVYFILTLCGGLLFYERISETIWIGLIAVLLGGIGALILTSGKYRSVKQRKR